MMKRSQSDISTSTSSSDAIPKKKVCNYGESCYRKNPEHFQTFSHPHLENILEKLEGSEIKLPDGYVPVITASDVREQLIVLSSLQKSTCSGITPPAPSSSQEKETAVTKNNSAVFDPPATSSCKISYGLTPSKMNIAEKLRLSEPYRYFLTSVMDVQETWSEILSVRFSELLNPVIGKIMETLQVNFMVELDWLMRQYAVHNIQNLPLTILYGDDCPELKSSNLPKHIKCYRIKPPSTFGHHHTKMSLLYYDDRSLRVIIGTANLIASDWENRTQGLWVSPLCPELPVGSDTGAGESNTFFKADLLRYLCSYQMGGQLQEWIGRVRRADFSKIRVFFIASIPGTHKGNDINLWGHNKLRNILKQYSLICKTDSPVITQCSSIGSLGATKDSWLCGEFLGSLSTCKRLGPPVTAQPAIKLVYPCVRNVLDSIHGALGGDCLPYSQNTHNKQRWLKDHMFQWKSDDRYRSQAMPHIKSYARISSDERELYWYVLTSANLSKAAWGSVTKNNGLYILSYEVGVLFLPQFLVGKDAFSLNKLQDKSAFSLPYDLPLLPYEKNDEPWVNEQMREALLQFQKEVRKAMRK